MKMILMTIILLIGTVQAKQPPKKILITFKQRFPSALNIEWTEEDNRIEGIFNNQKRVRDDENTWKANFKLGNKTTIARFTLDGHWLYSCQEISFSEIGVDEVKSAILRDYPGCDIISVIIHNSLGIGTWYNVKARCNETISESEYDYIGLPFPPRQ